MSELGPRTRALIDLLHQGIVAGKIQVYVFDKRYPTGGPDLFGGLLEMATAMDRAEDEEREAMLAALRADLFASSGQ